MAATLDSLMAAIATLTSMVDSMKINLEAGIGKVADDLHAATTKLTAGQDALKRELSAVGITCDDTKALVGRLHEEVARTVLRRKFGDKYAEGFDITDGMGLV